MSVSTKPSAKGFQELGEPPKQNMQAVIQSENHFLLFIKLKKMKGKLLQLSDTRVFAVCSCQENCLQVKNP